MYLPCKFQLRRCFWRSSRANGAVKIIVAPFGWLLDWRKLTMSGEIIVERMQSNEEKSRTKLRCSEELKCSTGPKCAAIGKCYWIQSNPMLGNLQTANLQRIGRCACITHAGAQATSLWLTMPVKEDVWSITSISSSILSLSIDIYFQVGFVES